MGIYGIANGTSSGSASLTLTVGSGTGTLQAPGSGDLIYITCGNGQGNTLVSVVDSQGQSYPSVVTAATSTSAMTVTCALINAKTLVSGTDTFTITFSASGQNFAVVKGCTGVASATADKTDGNKNGTGTTSPSSGATAMLSQAAELVVGAIQNSNAGGAPTGLSFGTGLTLNIATHGYHTEFDTLVNTSAAVTASGTITSAPWAATVATFLLSAPTVTTTSCPTGSVSAAYSKTLAASGGTPPYSSWTVASGSLPGGLTLNSSTGVISGTVSGAAGTFNFTVTVNDSAGQTSPAQALSIIITSGVVSITTGATLPNGTIGTAYTEALAATGGTSPYHWSLLSGTLPSPLKITSGSGGTHNAGVTVSLTGGSGVTAATYEGWIASWQGDTGSSPDLNIYPVTAQKIYHNTVGSYPAPANLAAADVTVRAAVAKGVAVYLCYKMTGNGTTNDTSWPGGADKPANSVILSENASLIASVQAYQNVGATVAGVIIYQEMDGSKRGPTGDGLTSQSDQIPYLYYRNYPLFKAALPSIPLICCYINYSETGPAAKAKYFPGPTPTNPLGQDLPADTGTAFTATNANPCVFTASGSAYTNGTRVVLTGGSLPGGFLGQAHQMYYVVGVSGSTFNLALTKGGTALASTSTGSGTVFQTGGTYCDGVGVDSYGDTWVKPPPETTTAAQLARVPYSANPTTAPGWADICDYNQVSAGFGWTEAGNSVSGNPSQAEVTYYLSSDSKAGGDPVNSVQAVYAQRVAAGLPNVPFMWYANWAGTGNNPITDPTDWRIPFLQAIDGTLASVTSASIAGTPAAAGTYTFTIKVKDSAATPNTATQQFTLTIGGTATALSITTSSLPDGQSGQSYGFSLSASGGAAPYKWSVKAGTLPSGVTLDASGTLSGTPNAVGTYSPKFTVTDSNSKTATVTLTLTVDPATAPPPVIVAPSLQPVKPWRFLVANPQPDGTYLAEIVQAQTRSVTFRTAPDQYHEATVDIHGSDPAAAFITELETDLQVLLGKDVLFCGRINACADQLDANQHRFQPSAVDYRELLRRRDFAYGGGPNFSAGFDVSDIAWGVLRNGVIPNEPNGFTGIQAYPGGALGIARGIGSGGLGVTQKINYTRGQMAGDVITQLAQMNPGGFDWDISAYGAADLRLDLWYPNRGVDRGVVLEWGGGLVAAIQRTTDASVFANSVLVTGATTSGNQLSETPSTGSYGSLDEDNIAADPAGRWDQVIGTQISTQSALDAYAAFSLASGEVVTPVYQIQLYPGAWQGTSHIWLGDYVTVRIQSGRLQVNDRLQVAEMDFTISPDNIETAVITLGRVPFRLGRKIPQILRRIRDLESM